jgi:hypothetical protein
MGLGLGWLDEQEDVGFAVDLDLDLELTAAAVVQQEAPAPAAVVGIPVAASIVDTAIAAAERTVLVLAPARGTAQLLEVATNSSDPASAVAAAVAVERETQEDPSWSGFGREQEAKRLVGRPISV